MASTVRLDTVCPGVFGISDRRYRQLAKEGIVPPVSEGLIDFVAATKALLSYYQKLVEGQGSITLTEEKARLTKTQADMAIMELRKREGTLLERDEVLRAWTGMISSARSRMLAIPDKITPALDGLNRVERKARLTEEVYEALAELAAMSSEDIKQAAVKPEHVEAKREEKGKGSPGQAEAGPGKKGGGKRNGKKLCPKCGKRKIDRRSKLCRKCAAKARERRG